MNDENKEPQSQPPNAEGVSDAPKSAAAEKPAAPAVKPAAPPPPPPEPGVVCKKLMAAGFQVAPLGNDAIGIEMIEVKPADILSVAAMVRDNDALKYDLLVCVAGVDWSTHRQAVYHLYSTYTATKLVLKVNAGSDEKVPSVTSIWPGADWHEREAYDLFGIIFEGHPDLKRILMPDDWIGYPLRKDYQNTDPRLVWNER